MPNVFLSPSSRSDKKFMVKVGDETVHFGQKGYQDYTMHREETRKKSYISRHQKNEDWNDWKTAGFWSRWLLWNKFTISDSIKDIEKKFPLNIIISKKIIDGKKSVKKSKKKRKSIK